MSTKEVIGGKDVLHQYLAAIGRRGGRAATGDKKRRSKEHYQRMAKISLAKRKAKKQSKMDATDE